MFNLRNDISCVEVCDSVSKVILHSSEIPAHICQSYEEISTCSSEQLILHPLLWEHQCDIEPPRRNLPSIKGDCSVWLSIQWTACECFHIV